MTLDRVAVLRGARPLASFSVLEIEAVDRGGANLARLAALIEATGYVTPEPRSEEEIARGYVAQAAEETGASVAARACLARNQGR